MLAPAIRRPIGTFALACATCALAAPGAGAQAIRTVNPAGPGGPGPWAGAVTDLQAALNASLPGDQVWIAAGTYKPQGGQAASFVIPSGVKVYGGFAGTELAPEQRSADTSSFATILSGDWLGNDPGPPTLY